MAYKYAGVPQYLRLLTGCLLLVIGTGCAAIDTAIREGEEVVSPTTPVIREPYDLLVPSIVQNGYSTRTWLRTLPVDSLAKINSLDRVDAIYLHALAEANGDLDDALLATLIAVLEHRHLTFTFGVRLPLTLESDSLFSTRIARLPIRIFADTPTGGDVDKLQHFFASAWLARTLDFGEVADVLGLGVEAGEQAFVIGGANDRRDVRANRLGQHFAELLRRNPHALPSSIINAWNKEFLRRRALPKSPQ